MRTLNVIAIFVASLVLTAFMGLAGCGEDHGYRVHGERDRAVPAPRYDNNRDQGGRGDWHEDRGGDYHR